MSLAQPMTFPQSVCTCRGSRAAMVCIELETALVLSIVCGATGKAGRCSNQIRTRSFAMHSGEPLKYLHADCRALS